jgi:formate dehydrogenase major subunit
MKMNDLAAKAETIEFKLNGDTISAFAGETILQAAERHGVEIPHLCYKDGYRPDGNCRACMVEIKGERVLAPSCCRQPAKGMEVQSNNARALASQKMVLELLLSDVPQEDLKPGANELFQWAGKLGVTRSRFDNTRGWTPDISHPAMDVNLDACIQCTRCVRACREEQVNDVIGYAFRGLDSKIVFDFDDPMGGSTCVACGEWPARPEHSRPRATPTR